VLDGANETVVDGRTSRGGIHLGRLDGKKRVGFRLRHMPLPPGKYWVTVGLESTRTGHLYHVQTQRYWFEVQAHERTPERLLVPVDVHVEDL
jgi:hypothetical protein